MALGDPRSNPLEVRLLTDISIRRKPGTMIADRVLSYAEVVMLGGMIGGMGDDYLRIEHDLVGGEAEYPRVSIQLYTSQTYLIKKHGLGITITEEMKNNVTLPFDAKKSGTEVVTDKLLLGREKALADTLRSTSVLTRFTTLSGTDRFDDYNSSDPEEIFMTAYKSIQKLTGNRLNMPGGFAIVPAEVMTVLYKHPKLKENAVFVTDMSGGLTDEQVRQAMKVDRLLVPSCRYNVAKEGQTKDIQPLWGTDIIFGYSPLVASLDMDTLGFRVQQKNSHRVFVNPVIDPPKAELVQVDISYDMILNDTDCAYLIKTAIS